MGASEVHVYTCVLAAFAGQVYRLCSMVQRHLRLYGPHAKVAGYGSSDGTAFLLLRKLEILK